LFNGKGRPLDLDAPAPTIPASMGGNATPIIDQSLLDGGHADWVHDYHASLIDGSPHHEPIPTALRRISVPEAAALQSFPLGMKFHGPLASQYRQVGNAVPPLLALHVANAAIDALAAIPTSVDFALA
jgi:DNA (cytosine-5)-methyltransferase 1